LSEPEFEVTVVVFVASRLVFSNGVEETSGVTFDRVLNISGIVIVRCNQMLKVLSLGSAVTRDTYHIFQLLIVRCHHSNVVYNVCNPLLATPQVSFFLFC